MAVRAGDGVSALNATATVARNVHCHYSRRVCCKCSSRSQLWRSHVEMRHFNMSWLWFPVLKPVRKHLRFTELLAAYLRAKGRPIV